MNAKMMSLFLVAFIVGAMAHAACGDFETRTIKGDEAVTLTYVLRNSSISTKTTVGATVTWSVANVICVQTNRGVEADLMPRYKCTSPSGVGSITAKSLWDAMSELGVMPDATTGHVYHQIKSTKCKVDKNGAGGMGENPSCNVTAAWGDQCS